MEEVKDMEKNDTNYDNEETMKEFQKLCEITGAPPQKIFEDLVHFNNVMKFLFKKDDPVAYIVMNHKLFPKGMPSPEEFLKNIVQKLNKPEDLNRMIREAKIELLKIRLINKFYKFIDWFKHYFEF